MQTVDIIVSSGLAAAGYEYGSFWHLLTFYYVSFFCVPSIYIVNLDDCWQVSRDTDGTIVADPKAFPSGMKGLADYVHSRKLKFGLYSGVIMIFIKISFCSIGFRLGFRLDAGYKTCGGRPGSHP